MYNFKGHNSVKNVRGVAVFFLCISSDGGLYLYKSFVKIFWTVLKLGSRHDFHIYNFKGHNSVKNVCGVVVLFLCNSSDGGLYLYKVS